MKKIIFLLAFCLSFAISNAQSVTSSEVEYTRNENTFTSVKKEKTKTPDEKTIYNWEDNKGIKYPIYISNNGSCYIIRTSSKTGKEYKQYLNTEISKEICKELGREYKGKQKK